jgi:hypothetical protein
LGQAAHRICGGGEGEPFTRFIIRLDVMGHELTHGVTEDKANLIYVYSLILTFSRQGGRDLGEKGGRAITYRHSRMDLRRQVARISAQTCSASASAWRASCYEGPISIS